MPLSVHASTTVARYSSSSSVQIVLNAAAIDLLLVFIDTVTILEYHISGDINNLLSLSVLSRIKYKVVHLVAMSQQVRAPKLFM